MERSKYQIHAEIRRVLARHWIDPERLQFGAHRGIVRISGELHYTRSAGRSPSTSIVEVLQAEILRIREVTRVQFDLTDWRRDDAGVWREQGTRTLAGEDPRAGELAITHPTDPSGGQQGDD